MTQITDAARTDLHTRVRDVLGEQEGDTLMAHLPPVGWADVATKKDVDHLAAATKKDIATLATRTEVLELKVAMERGFRRQSMWIVTLFVAQNAFFLYVAERLAN